MAKVIHSGDLITLSNDKAYAVFKVIEIGERTFIKTKEVDTKTTMDTHKIANTQNLDKQFEYFEEVFDDKEVNLTRIQDKVAIQKLETL